jgi:hypothetical protein
MFSTLWGLLGPVVLWVEVIAAAICAALTPVHAAPLPEHVRCWSGTGLVVDAVVGSEWGWHTGPRCLPPCEPEDGYWEFRAPSGALYDLYRGTRDPIAGVRRGDPCLVAPDAVPLTPASAQCEVPVCVPPRPHVSINDVAPLPWIELGPDLRCMRPAGVVHTDGTCRARPTEEDKR